jgi:hypothetical protein
MTSCPGRHLMQKIVLHSWDLVAATGQEAVSE